MSETQQHTTPPGAICPHCDVALTEEQIKSLWARYTLSKRTGVLRGQPRVPSKCEKCGITCATARGARDHCRLSMSADGITEACIARVPECVRSIGGKIPHTIEGLYAHVHGLLEHDVITSRSNVRKCKAYLRLLVRAERRITAAEVAV